jgi:hypothetical protein
MPWGRVDDSLYDNPKLDKLGKDRLACVGLHFLAISWCNRWLTDGLVPADRVSRLGGTPRLVAALVGADLWEPVGDGYHVHDFLEFNDSREQVLATRAAEREKKRKQRAVGAGKAVGSGAVVNDPTSGRFMSPEASLAVSPDVSPGDSRGVSPSTRPVPSRPVPSINGVVPLRGVSTGAPVTSLETPVEGRAR